LTSDELSAEQRPRWTVLSLKAPRALQPVGDNLWPDNANETALHVPRPRPTLGRGRTLYLFLKDRNRQSL